MLIISKMWKVLLPLAALIIVAIVIGMYVKGIGERSEVYLRNGYGALFLVTKGSIDGDTVPDAEGLNLDTGKRGFMWVNGPARPARFELEISATGGPRSISCVLDNTKRPCFFEAFITSDGRLVCGPCTRND